MWLLLTIFLFVVATVWYFGGDRWRQLRKTQQFSKLHGCQPIRVRNPRDFFGIKEIFSMSRHYANKTLLAENLESFERNGDTYESHILGTRVLMTCDPRNVKQIHVARFADFDSSNKVRAHLIRPITGKGIFAVDGPEWKAARELYRGHFANTRSITNLVMLERHTQSFISQIQEPAKAFDLQPLVLKLMLDIATEFSMGESSESLSIDQSREKKQFAEAFIIVKDTIAKDAFLGPLATLSSKRKFHRSCAEVHCFVEKIIKKALEKKAHAKEKELSPSLSVGNSILQSLMKNTTDVLELRDGVISIMIAAVDSISSLLSTVFFQLARNERVFQKLRIEVIETVGYGTPTFDQLRNLTYLQWIFNECMRTYPPFPFGARTANKDTTLPTGGGRDGKSPVLVKKGQRVIYSAWASHRSVTAFGEDALEFRPERWESLTPEALAGYVPFNGGPRVCPGQQYAIMEASYVVIRMLQTFSNMKNSDSRPWTENIIGLALTNENGVILELERAVR